jgi:hypothetical protein
MYSSGFLITVYHEKMNSKLKYYEHWMNIRGNHA